MVNPDPPLVVAVPPPEADRPAWSRVGAIAAAGFVIGIAWPQLTGTRFAPSPPSDAPAAATSAEAPRPAASSSAAVTAPSASSSAAPAAAKAPAPAALHDDGPAVSPGAIVRCRDARGKSREECGTLPFDPLAVPRLQSLSKCSAAPHAVGKLALGIDVDFKRKAVHVARAKGTTLARPTADALVKCATTAFANASLDEIDHTYPRYTLVYGVQFAPPGTEAGGEPDAASAPAVGATSSETPASGSATVVFDSAVVRDAPKTGAVVGRVLRGAKVRLAGKQGDWYRVTFGAAARSGWMHRSSIGL